MSMFIQAQYLFPMREGGGKVTEFMPKYYRIGPRIRSDEEMAQEFRELNIKAIL